jgi:hypothetical protein
MRYILTNLVYIVNKNHVIIADLISSFQNYCNIYPSVDLSYVTGLIVLAMGLVPSNSYQDLWKTR